MLEDRLSVRASFISGYFIFSSFHPSIFSLRSRFFFSYIYTYCHSVCSSSLSLSLSISLFLSPFLLFSFPLVHIFIRSVLHSPLSRVFPNSILNLNHDLTVATLCSLLLSQAPRSWACSYYKLPNYNSKGLTYSTCYEKKIKNERLRMIG